ncbi:MAG TPA: hypothetical protein VH372_22290 [Actinospica sp.]|nr:hypothetical protein [Actinospica sp.]
MSSVPYIVQLPARPSIEQLRRQAKDLQRAVRGRRPVALELAAHHAPHRMSDPAQFALDAAQLVIARHYGFASWQVLRQHVEEQAGGDGRVREATRTTADYYRLRPDWAAAGDVQRCAAAAATAAQGRYSDPTDWVPLLSTYFNGLTVIAFDSPSGIVFAELTPSRITLALVSARQEPPRVPRDVPRPLSQPVAQSTRQSTAQSASQPAERHLPPRYVPQGPGSQASVAFHTRFGTIAGLIEPGITSLAVERPADTRARQHAAIANGVFVVPNAFLVDETGVVLRAGSQPRGEIVPFSALPPRAEAVVDRPRPATPDLAGHRAALEAADAPPIVDPELWRPGVRAEPAAGESVQIARYGRLILWQRSGERASLADPIVFDFTPQRGPLRDFAVVGRGLSVTRMYYDFADGPGKVAVVGLIDDERVTAVVLRRSGLPDLPARIAGGTFLIAAPELTELPEDGRDRAFIVAMDQDGEVLEQLAYRD